MYDENMIPVECVNAQEKYDGKRVRFFVDDRYRQFLVTGVFHVKLAPTRISIEVFAGYDARACHFDFYRRTSL